MMKLENDRLVLECVPRSGEILSLYDKKTDTELMYQRDGAWSDSNPTLFPIVGNTWNGKYEIDGQEYAMKNHGLIRYADLTPVKKENAVCFEYDATAEDLKQYPFPFHFVIEYTLEDNKVHIRYEVTNTGTENMPFTFGLHPAFRVPQKAGEVFEDYRLVYEPAGKALQLHFDGDKTWCREEEITLADWQLNRQDIKEAATLVYKHPACTKAVLCYKEEPRITVSFPGFPYLAVWTHPEDSDFLCIEPWYGHADFVKQETDFANREGMMALAPGQSWKTDYTIEAEG